MTVESISKMNDIDLLALAEKRLLLTPPGQVPKLAVLRHHFPQLLPGAPPRQSRGPNALKTQSLTLTGAALMQNGITLPITWPASIWVLEGQRL